MFREMRRSQQQLSAEDTKAVMERCTNGVLACLGDEEYPYAVPLSYVYHKGKIYFHSAKSGHKIDAITKHPKVSFAVIDEDTIVGEKFTSYFRSVIAFGKARVAEREEWLEAMRALVEKYSAAAPEALKAKEISGGTQAHVMVIDVEHITGKEAIEYVRARQTQRAPS
ncbi:MAG: pyridoxamine 5'-phosphate oxidase family protein [Clostridiales bacterium]|nr:pyridoxamine 5'-phosphate oxidase family protein [Clostridiales bacterium]